MEIEFPSFDRPDPIKRNFPSFACVDGFTARNFAIIHIPSDEEEDEDFNEESTVYNFVAWSMKIDGEFRISPRQDIDLALAAYNLPSSHCFLSRHRTIKVDDLDARIDYADNGTYGFVVEISRKDFADYYYLITQSPFFQDNFDEINFVWDWRDLPVACPGNYNFVLFHLPGNSVDVGGPVTHRELVSIFRETYPDADPETTYLRVLADSDAGDSGNIYIFEEKEMDDSGILTLGRSVTLPSEQYVVVAHADVIAFGLRAVFYGDEDQSEPEVISSDLQNDPHFRLFGDPEETIYVDDLIGPDFDKEQ